MYSVNCVIKLVTHSQPSRLHCWGLGIIRVGIKLICDMKMGPCNTVYNLFFPCGLGHMVYATHIHQDRFIGTKAYIISIILITAHNLNTTKYGKTNRSCNLYNKMQYNLAVLNFMDIISSVLNYDHLTHAIIPHINCHRAVLSKK